MNDYHRSHEDARNEHNLRVVRYEKAMTRYLVAVGNEVARLLREQPHLESASTDVLFARMVVAETDIGYDSALKRAAFGVLHLRAKDRAEMADPFTGSDAA